MTELSFLLELLLNHKLPKATREAVTARIKDVEMMLGARATAPGPYIAYAPPPAAVPAHLANQSPSTIAAMMRHEQKTGGVPIMQPDAAVVPAPPPPVITPTIIAQTPAAVAAMNARQETINLAMSGKPAKGETSPRKF